MTTQPAAQADLWVRQDHGAYASSIRGTAEPGAVVKAYDAQGRLIGSAESDAQGGFIIHLPQKFDGGEPFEVRAIGDGVSKVPAQVAVPDLKVPEVPYAEVKQDGDIRGTAEPGSTVTVSQFHGSRDLSSGAGPDGSSNINVNGFYPAGTVLYVRASDSHGNVRGPAEVTISPALDGLEQGAESDDMIDSSYTNDAEGDGIDNFDNTGASGGQSTRHDEVVFAGGGQTWG